MSVWTIRAAQGSDMDQLMELRLALQEHLEGQNPRIWHLSAQGREQLRERLAQILPDCDACVLVAVESGETIVGMIVGQVSRSDSRMPAISGSIGLLFVREPWRRRGIGSELVKRLCRFFASHCVEDISVRYVVGDHEATRFWSKLGFQPRIVTAGTDLHDLEGKIAGHRERKQYKGYANG